MVVRTIDLQMIFPWSNQSSVDQLCFTTVNHLSMVFFRSESLLFRYFDEGFHNFHPYGGQFPLKAKVTPKKIWTKKTNPTSSGYCYLFIYIIHPVASFGLSFIRRPLPSLGLGGAAPRITVGVRPWLHHLWQLCLWPAVVAKPLSKPFLAPWKPSLQLQQPLAPRVVPRRVDPHYQLLPLLLHGPTYKTSQECRISRLPPLVPKHPGCATLQESCAAACHHWFYRRYLPVLCHAFEESTVVCHFGSAKPYLPSLVKHFVKGSAVPGR